MTDARSTNAAVPAGFPGQRDPLIAALARYIEALHDRYPDGPDQMSKEALDARGNIRRMRRNGPGRAA